MTKLADLERWQAAGDFTTANSDVEQRAKFPVSSCKFNLAAIERYRLRNAADKLARIAIDRSPDNVERAHLLSNTFPPAKFVHLMRYGRAMFNSVQDQSLGPWKPLRSLRNPPCTGSATRCRRIPGTRRSPGPRLRWFGEQLLHSRAIKPLRQKSRRKTIRVSFK